MTRPQRRPLSPDGADAAHDDQHRRDLKLLTELWEKYHERKLGGGRGSGKTTLANQISRKAAALKQPWNMSKDTFVMTGQKLPTGGWNLTISTDIIDMSLTQDSDIVQAHGAGEAWHPAPTRSQLKVNYRNHTTVIADEALADHLDEITRTR